MANAFSSGEWLGCVKWLLKWRQLSVPPVYPGADTLRDSVFLFALRPTCDAAETSVNRDGSLWCSSSFVLKTKATWWGRQRWKTEGTGLLHHSWSGGQFPCLPASRFLLQEENNPLQSEVTAAGFLSLAAECLLPSKLCALRWWLISWGTRY